MPRQKFSTLIRFRAVGQLFVLRPVAQKGPGYSASAGFERLCGLYRVARFSRGFAAGQSSFTAVPGRQHNCFPSALIRLKETNTHEPSHSLNTNLHAPLISNTGSGRQGPLYPKSPSLGGNFFGGEFVVGAYTPTSTDGEGGSRTDSGTAGEGERDER
jgi:hypothetical protein